MPVTLVMAGWPAASGEPSGVYTYSWLFWQDISTVPSGRSSMEQTKGPEPKLAPAVPLVGLGAAVKVLER